MSAYTNKVLVLRELYDTCIMYDECYK